MKAIVLLLLVFLFSLICAGCIQSLSRGGWTRCKSLDELWPGLKDETIESLSLCDGDWDTDVELWFVYGEVPKETLERCKETLIDGIEPKYGLKAEKFPTATCQGMLKIVTDKGKYVAPAGVHRQQNDWKEYSNLVGLWPRLQKQKIKSIGFYHEIIALDIDLRHAWYVPQGNLDECIRLIDTAMKNADRNFRWGPDWQERIKIITNKGKYLVPAETDICTTASPSVSGNGWSSAELGQFLKKCGICKPDANKPAQKPSQ